MRRLVVTALVFSSLLSLTSFAASARDSRLPLSNTPQPIEREARWSVGVLVGEPFGLALKRYLPGANAWDVELALAYGPGFRLGADYLWGLGRLEQHAKFDFDAYLGAGAFAGVLQGPCGFGFFRDRCGSGGYVGARMPVGVELLLKEAPLIIGVEVAPGVAVGSSDARFLLDVIVAVRGSFNL